MGARRVGRRPATTRTAAGLASVVLALAACGSGGGGDGADESGDGDEGGAPTTIRSADAETTEPTVGDPDAGDASLGTSLPPTSSLDPAVLDAGTALIDMFGSDAPAVLLYAIERGYDDAQIADAIDAGSVTSDGSIPGLSPAGPREGVIALPGDPSGDPPGADDEESSGVPGRDAGRPMAFRRSAPDDAPLMVDRMRAVAADTTDPDLVIVTLVLALHRSGYSLEQITDAIVLGSPGIASASSLLSDEDDTIDRRALCLYETDAQRLVLAARRIPGKCSSGFDAEPEVAAPADGLQVFSGMYSAVPDEALDGPEVGEPNAQGWLEATLYLRIDDGFAEFELETLYYTSRVIPPPQEDVSVLDPGDEIPQCVTELRQRSRALDPELTDGLSIEEFSIVSREYTRFEGEACEFPSAPNYVTPPDELDDAVDTTICATPDCSPMAFVVGDDGSLTGIYQDAWTFRFPDLVDS